MVINLTVRECDDKLNHGKSLEMPALNSDNKTRL